MIKTVFIDLPATIKGFTVRTCDSDGDSFTIVLNASLTAEQQRDAYKHEIDHIENNDFYADLSVQLIEMVAHTNDTAKGEK